MEPQEGRRRPTPLVIVGRATSEGRAHDRRTMTPAESIDRMNRTGIALSVGRARRRRHARGQIEGQPRGRGGRMRRWRADPSQSVSQSSLKPGAPEPDDDRPTIVFHDHPRRLTSGAMGQNAHSKSKIPMRQNHTPSILPSSHTPCAPWLLDRRWGVAWLVRSPRPTADRAPSARTTRGRRREANNAMVQP